MGGFIKVGYYYLESQNNWFLCRLYRHGHFHPPGEPTLHLLSHHSCSCTTYISCAATIVVSLNWMFHGANNYVPTAVQMLSIIKL